jgi:hypothetical protein
MGRRKVYVSPVKAVRGGNLREPFTGNDFKKACPGLDKGTCNAFLYKHGVGNRGGNSGLVKKVCTGKFTLVRPWRYCCDC